jgi:hypothetical protein
MPDLEKVIIPYNCHAQICVRECPKNPSVEYEDSKKYERVLIWDKVLQRFV